MKLLKSIILTLLVGTWLSSCQQDKGKNIPDVSHLTVDLNIHRFDQILFQIDTNQVRAEIAQLHKDFPDFSNAYFNNVLRMQADRLGQERFEEVLKGFIRFPSVQKLHDTCSIVYPNLDELEKELEQAFQFYQYYFPDQPIPQVYTFISEYVVGAFVGDNDVLGIGLDFFLGEDYPYYDPLYFPQYIKRTMRREYIATRAMEALINDKVPPPGGERLIDLMINNGKKLYLLDQILPYSADSIKLSYTQEQVQWCADNEMQIWAYLLDEELLYSTHYQDIRKLVDHSPHSPGMPPEAPGRTANWIGWQIVQQYMQRHPETTISDLLVAQDAQAFLEKSRYKPRK